MDTDSFMQIASEGSAAFRDAKVILDLANCSREWLIAAGAVQAEVTDTVEAAVSAQKKLGGSILLIVTELSDSASVTSVLRAEAIACLIHAVRTSVDQSSFTTREESDAVAERLSQLGYI